MKNLTWIGFGLVVLAQNAFALPGLDVVQKQFERKLNVRPASRQNASSCTDFSGSWKGQCTAAGETSEGALEIKQEGCDSLYSGSDLQQLGSLKTISESGAKFSYGFAAASNWNEGQTEIHYQYGGLVKVDGKADSIPMSGKATMRLQDGKLAFDIDALGITVSCVYDKR